MFYDLNVPCGPDDPELYPTLSFLAERMSFFPTTRPMLEMTTLEES